MKINIFYKHYETNESESKPRPPWFSYEKCFVNLLSTIKKESDIDLYLIMDGRVNNNFIKKYKNNFTAYEITAGSDRASSLKLYPYIKKVIKNQKDFDLIYILENDYLHVNGWVKKLKELFNTYSNLNYVSLYDHNDKYFLPMYENLVSKVFTTKTHHWRTTPSTCGSFIVNKKVFLEDYDIPFKIPGDHNKFLWLNKNKNRFVTTPIPGLNTHCMSNLLSPTIDWQYINEKS